MFVFVAIGIWGGGGWTCLSSLVLVFFPPFVYLIYVYYLLYLFHQ